MSRSAVAKLTIVLGLALGGFLVWSLLYEVIAAVRYQPGVVGEGANRFALLQYQASEKSLSSIGIAFGHFWERVVFPDTRIEALIRAGLALLITLAAGAGAAIAARVLKKPAPYGDARFGRILDAEKKGLLTGKGLVLGLLNGSTLTSDAPAHALVVGPTRSGKGVSFVIPNGYVWHGSSVWFDPKRENVAALASHRQSLGDKVFVFSPGERNSHRYNPLDFVQRDERMATDALVVASFLIPDDGREIWGRSARILLAAMIGFVLSAKQFEGRRHLRAVAELTTTQADFRDVLKLLLKGEQDNVPQWVTDGFNQFIAIEPETRNSALFNITTALGPWNNELIAAATADTDFDIRNLRRERIAIFIGCSIAQLDIFRPVLKLLIQQIHDQLMSSLPGRDEPFQVLMMIDEFRQLGRMDDLVSKLTINAGYGFRMCLILQDVSQLDELYGKAVRETTVSACQVKLFIRINDMATSEYVSEMLGSRTQEVATPTIRSGHGGMFSRRDRSIHYIERPLRAPQELREMSEDIAILLVPNAPPFEIRKIRHFADMPYAKIHADNMFKHFEAPSLSYERLKRSVAKDDLTPSALASIGETRPVRGVLTTNPEMSAVPIAHTVNKSGKRKRPETEPPISKAPDHNQEEVSLFATITAAKETAQEEMAVLVRLASKLKLDPVLFESILLAARQFEEAAR
jgi:type IV secretion system protein VirD4